MRLNILGHLQASVDDRPIALGGAKQRAILAMLGLEANRTVTADRLIEGLWGDEPPPSAAKMVQNYVWRLRQVLTNDGGAEILTRGRGYELRIDRELVDVCRLERLVSEAARSAENGGPANGSAREALALFRGEPLADVAEEPFARAEIRRLEELRLTAEELAIEADLAAGRHQEVVGEIDALLAENPLRERLHGQRMVSLYRCGRQAEALEAYRDARRTLIDEIGVEPTPELRGLHDAILRQDPSLDVEPAVTDLPSELDTAASPPLIGRDDDVRRLRAHWLHAAAGAGALVTLAGGYGMGKTRLAAELASDAHREGATVVYAAGTGPPEAVPKAIARARGIRRPALIVIDNADRVPPDVRAALRALAPALGRLPVLVLATGQEAAALARLEPQDAIVLEPLDADAVRGIAGFYAPAGGAVPVETLLEASRGVPRRVHEVAREWARHEATRRVDAVAGRAAAGRTEARALEAELAGTVADLQSVRERAGDGEESGTPAVCPYKGLATFGAEDAEYFFGREQLVAELVSQLVGEPLLAIVGPSGSGKSSVLRAGLLPALAGGVLPGSANWTQALIRPGEQPMRELRRATRRLDRERNGVLAVDQFEELFTVCADEAERAEFVAALVRIARDRQDRCVVVLTVRADFYGRCAAYPELSRLLGANHVLVGQMSRDELRRTIERPAQRVGLTVEPELVEALLSDVDGRPGALPLLSTALLELWSGRDGSRVRLAAYARSGGVQGAVARMAEDAFLRLDPAQQAETRKLMLRLADEDESGAIVRRRLELAELDCERSREVVDRLADRRLLTVSDGAVEVAHEALLREWPRLRGWLDEDVQGRRLQRRLSEAARAWDADDRDPGGLYRGARLAAALEWAAGHEDALNATERAFLDEGRRASGRAQRRLRLVLAGVASLLVLAVIAGVVALDQRGRARAEATAAAAQGLGARALSERELDRALLLARQGLALDDSLDTRGNLLATLLKSPAAIAVLRGDGAGMTSVALSPDDRTLAFVDTDGILRRLDARTLRPLAQPQIVPTPNGWVDLRFSDDGSRLAAGGGEALILDPRTQRVHARLGTSRNILGQRFSPDGRTLFALVDDYSGRFFVQRFDARGGRPLGEPVFVARVDVHQPSLQVTPDGRRVVTSIEDGSTVVRDARTLRPLKRLRVGSTAAALSPDGRTLLAGARDGSVRFLDLVTGGARTASGRHDALVLTAAFSADGRTAVTGGEDSRVIVWDVRRAAPRELLTGHSGVVSSLAISGDGRTLYGAVLDGKVLVWDLAGDRRPGRRFDIGPGHPAGSWLGTLASHALSPDGRVLAVGQQDGSVALIDARTLHELSRFDAVPDGAVAGMAYMPGGRLLAVGGSSGFLAVVDLRSHEVVRQLHGHTSPVRMPSFSDDGRLMATASADTVMLWSLQSGRPVGPPLHRYSNQHPIAGAALSPDGRTLAVASELGVEILDVVKLKLRLRTTLEPPGPAYGVRFTPDSRYLAAGRSEGWTQLVSTDTWRPVGGRLAGHTAEVMSLSVSPNGRTLATGSMDGTVRLFDLATRRPLGAPLPAVTNRIVEPRFTPDGAFLFAITDAGQAYRWDVRPASWARHACAVAGRTLTRSEWNDVLPGRGYAPACG